MEGEALRSVRVRVTAVASALVLLVLALTGLGVLAVHHRVLLEGVGETLADAARDVAADHEVGRLGPTAGFGDEDAAYQVVASDGSVLAASANLRGVGPIAPAPATRSAVRTLQGLPHDAAAFRVRSQRSDATAGVVVHVALSLDDATDSTAALRRALAVAVPGATAALAVLLWILVGRLLQRAATAVARQQQFVADASHELRSPLTRIRTELEVDLAHPATADPLATHQLVLEEAIGLQRLVDDLLQLARLDAGDQGWPARPVDLDAVVASVVRDLRAEGGPPVDLGGLGAAQVRGDPDRLRRLVANLVDNARRHGRRLIRIEIETRDGTAMLAVADDGPGIAPADRRRVFDRFSRLEESRNGAGGGAGLGLAIAREIAEAHGGSIEVDPNYAAGARLVVTLPLG
jgi:signal transduction histidine kinase